MAERVRVREITDEEGPATAADPAPLDRVGGHLAAGADGLADRPGDACTQDRRGDLHQPRRVRDIIHNFNADGFDALYPRYRRGRQPTFTLVQRRAIKQVALSRPTDHGLAFSTWSLSKLADFLVAEGVVNDISHEGLRVLLRQEVGPFNA